MENPEKIHISKNNVHKVLAHSYAMYFILFLIGVSLDLVFRFKIFKTSVMVPTGASLIIFATLLIFWAQHTSRNLKKDTITKDNFFKGPYRFSRSPTHWGLFFLMLGFGVIANAIFVVLTTLISFLISRYIFLDKEEEILKQKYGQPYTEYRKAVKL